MPSPMRLRKSVKPPKRYEDELEVGGHLIRSPSLTSRPKSYRGKVIEHNPDLPPAAFPTLDPRRPTPPRTNQQQLNHQKMPSTQRKHAHSPTASPPHQQPATNFSNRDLNHPFSLRDPVFDYPLDNMTGFDPFSQQHMDNGIGNPIWERNMALLDGFEQRTDLEWAEAEMATSDEGSPTSRTRKENALLIAKTADSSPPPLWEDIPVSLRVQMVHAAAGKDRSAETALFRLGLDPKQRDVMMEALRKYYEREEAQDDRVSAHIRLMQDALMKGNKRYTTREAFSTLAGEHLYQVLDRDDTVATRREVRLAEAYMLSFGLSTKFLEDWKPNGAGAESDAQLSVTPSGGELDANDPSSVSMPEVLVDKKDVTERAVAGKDLTEQDLADKDLTEHDITVHDVSDLVSKDPRTPSPQENHHESTELQRASSESNEPAISGQGWPSHAASSQTTGEVIEVDAGAQEISPSSISTSDRPSSPTQPSSTTQPSFQLNGDPQTPQAFDAQYPLFGQTLETLTYPWPQTPPTPSVATRPLQDDSGSDQEPSAKRLRMSSSSKSDDSESDEEPDAKRQHMSPDSEQPVPETADDSLPALNTGIAHGTATEQLGLPVRIPQKHSAVVLIDQQASHSTDAVIVAESSSAPTDQEGSTIVVENPSQGSTPATQQEPGTSNDSTDATLPTPQGKAARGRGRPKKLRGG
ncbi:MAG: hypothetical protein LQ345_003890 [Seirophora villosa]|nr:MAG: hypothetical protein LQ345_003890 [Seirophora villosa]